jgi:hypothetical protein
VPDRAALPACRAGCQVPLTLLHWSDCCDCRGRVNYALFVTDDDCACSRRRVMNLTTLIGFGIWFASVPVPPPLA